MWNVTCLLYVHCYCLCIRKITPSYNIALYKFKTFFFAASFNLYKPCSTEFKCDPPLWQTSTLRFEGIPGLAQVTWSLKGGLDPTVKGLMDFLLAHPSTGSLLHPHREWFSTGQIFDQGNPWVTQTAGVMAVKEGKTESRPRELWVRTTGTGSP